MPILSVTTSSGEPVATTTCVECLAEAEVKINDLVLGSDHHESVIALPACKCGAQEFLQRTTDVHPDESKAGHRKKVNALAEHLRQTGRVHPKHVGAARAMKTPAQVGELIGHVPESSLPEHIVAPKRKLRAVTEAAASAEASAASTPTPAHAEDPAAVALKLFAMGHKILAELKGKGAAPAAPAPEPAS